MQFNTRQISPAAPWPFPDSLLAERLVAHGYVTEPLVGQFMAEAQQWRTTLTRILRARGVLTDVGLRDAIAYVFGLGVVDANTRPIGASAVANFPVEYVTSKVAIPVGVAADRIIVAVDDAARGDILGKIFELTGFILELRIATPEQMTALAEGRAPEAEDDRPASVATTAALVADEDPWVDDEDKSHKVSVRRRAAWISFWSRVIAQAIGASALVFLGLTLAGGLPDGCSPAADNTAVEQQQK
jgi:hypothetical protein